MAESERVFDLDNGEKNIVIVTDGRVQKSPVPDGFNPQTFRDILAVINIGYIREGVVPSVDEAAKLWPQIKKRMYAAAYACPELEQALTIRGIPFGKNTGLSPEQIMAVQLLSDPTDRRTLNTKLRQIGISMPKYQNWMRQPLFSQALNQRMEHNLGDAVHVAMNRLIGNADAGDQRAIEKVLEISGRWNPQQQEINSARQVVLVLVEAVLKHVSSKDERNAILSEVESVMQKGAIMNSLGSKELGQ